MKILLIKTSSLGDVVHALPALTDAAWLVPNLSCDWVVEENFAEIPKWHPIVNKVIPIALRRWRKAPLKALFSGEIRKFWKNLRAEKYDLIIDAQGLFFKSGLLSLIAHGKGCGYDWDSARDKFASLCYRHKFIISKEEHAISRIRELFAQSLGYKIPKREASYAIDLARIGVDLKDNWHGKNLVFVHGTSRDDKCWSEEYWLELTRIATQAGFLVKIPWGSKAELERAERIAANSQNVEVLPKLNLSQLAQVFLKATAVIAVDTGLGHLSAALGIPTISLYGTTDPKLIGTVGKCVIHFAKPNLDEISPNDVWGAI